MNKFKGRFGVALIAAIPLLACLRGEARTASADSVPVTKATAAAAPRSDQAAAFRFVLSPTGTAARYRVRERLVGHDLPNDAIGETKNFTGAIEFDAHGKVLPLTSKFVVDAGTFVSDKDRRDGFVRGRLLEAEQYPSIVLVPTNLRGVVLPLPTSGTLPIVMTGDLTVHGVTRPTTWKGSATFQNGQITGTAETAFTFDEIHIEQPRVPVLLSVADTIRLEIDFTLVRQR